MSSETEYHIVLYAPVHLCDGSEVVYEKSAPRIPQGIIWHKGVEYEDGNSTFKVKKVRVSEDGLYAFVWMKKIILCACSESRFVKEMAENGWT